MKGYFKKVLCTALLPVILCGCTGKTVVGDDASHPATKIRIVDVDLTSEEYGIGVDKDKKDLLAKTNEFIDKSMNDGLFDEITAHYLGDGEPVMIESADLDESHDQLVVASTLDFEPFEYGKVGEYYGIDMEIASALADYLGKELVIVNSSFETMFISVNQHKCDICIGGISITEERKKLVDFTKPYFYTGQRIAIRDDNKEFDNVKTADDIEEILSDKTKSTVIGVENLTVSEDYCKGNDEYGYAGFPVTVKGYRDAQSAIEALADGECDYMVGDYAPMALIVNRINGE